MEYATLQNGLKMPMEGFGVFQARDKEECKRSVLDAIRTGYRLIDTAAFYENEKEVGEGIKDSGIPRDDLFITTKLWNDMQRESCQRESFEKSLDNLGVDAVDLYLIHWPIPGKIKETWHVLEQLYEEGLVKAIGVSNFLPHHLEELSVHANIAPAVDQFECNPYLRNTISYRRHGVRSPVVRALTTRFCKALPKSMKKILHRLFCATMCKTASSQFQNPPKKHESSAIRRFLILN